MAENKTNNSSAGKGDKPRNCFSQNYRNNYDLIVWKNKKNENGPTIKQSIHKSLFEK
jgi:hypothetical protein